MSFAKIYEREGKQVLVLKTEEPGVDIMFEASNEILGISSAGFEYADEDARDSAFDSITEDKAFHIVGRMDDVLGLKPNHK